jgi:type I restriction enzyme S subunit
MAGKYQAYPEYRDLNSSWVGKIPSHWISAPLKRVCNLSTGLTPPTSDEANYVDYDSGLPWVRPEDLNEEGNSTKASKFLSQKGWDLMRLVPKEATLICCIGTIGKAGYIQTVVSTNQQITAASFHYSPRYNYYLIQAAREIMEETATGNVIQILNSERLSGIPFLSIPRNEADKIANFLDHETAKIDTLIEKQQQLIKLIKEKRQAVISHAVTKGLNPNAPMRDSGIEWLGEVPEHWDVSRVGHCAFVTKLTGFEYTNLWEIEEDGEVIALRGFNVKERKLELSDVERISSELSAKLVRSKLAKGDIVFPCTGTIGNAAVIEGYDSFHINQNIAKIRFDETVSPRFVLYWLTSSFVRTLIDRNNTSGMQPVVLIGDIRKLPMPRIYYQEQEGIASYLDLATNKFNRLISSSESAIELVKERRTALISAAVTGKIDVRNWVAPEPSSTNNKEDAA